VTETRLRVAPPGRVPTDVRVGAGLLPHLDAALSERLPRAARRLYVVDAGVADPTACGRWSPPWIPPPGALRIPAGEACKTRETHAAIEDRILAEGITRDDVVVAVGGGAAIDVAGFASATARRGVPWAAVPTSVVAQADAAVGGKTAVNHARGKNLLGAFHPPVLVLADVGTLSTLPVRDRVAGLAEVYKAGVVGDAGLVDLLRRRTDPPDDAFRVEIVSRALAVKARLVEEDERDEGRRRLLNYGHTVGHALEACLGNGAVRHGEAIAIGMGVAARLAAARGLVPAAFATEQDGALRALGLPTEIPPAADRGALLSLLASDKKRRAGATHAMVLPRGIERLEVFEDVTTAEIESATR
jgi:3-dehydroquinate synthetase